MAEIQEYLPQVSSPEPVGGVSPNIELAGAVGRSMQNLGGTLEQAGAALHQRQSQRESADVYSNTAQARADNFQAMDSGLQDGSFDKDKFFEKFDKDSADYGSTLTTPEAKNYFERQNARLRGSLLKHATLGEAQIASREAVGNFVSAKNANAQTIFNHPDQFDDINESTLEHADQLSGVGAIPAKMRDKLFQDTSREYAVSAVLGTAEVNPTAARALLKDPKFSTYFSTEQREALSHGIDRAETAKNTELIRENQAQKIAQKARSDAWVAGNLPALATGSLSVKTVNAAVQKGDLTGPEGFDWIKRIRAAAKQTHEDPVAFDNYANRIANPSASNGITDFQSQVAPDIGKRLSPGQANALHALMNKTDEQKQYTREEKSLFDVIDKMKVDSITNQKDDLGMLRAAQAKQAYIEAKKDAQKNGTLLQLLNADPNDKNSFYSRLSNYAPTSRERMDYFKQQRLKDQMPKEKTPLPEEHDPAGMQKFLDRTKNK